MVSCKVFNCKKVDCQIGQNGECGICVKLPCNGSGKCEDVRVECCTPQELAKCCQDKGHGNECCVCMLCENGRLSKVVIDCCGKRQEVTPAQGRAVCVSVPQTKEGGGQVQVKECAQDQMESCCSEATGDGKCCCVCVRCHEGCCQAYVCCPQSVAGQSTAGEGGQCCTAKSCC